MPFNIGDIVDTVPTVANQRQGGRVRYMACYNATMAGGRTCDKKTCQHSPRDYIWVLWNGQKTTVSYHESELVPQASPSIEKISEQTDGIAPEAKAIIKDKFADIENSSGKKEADIDWDKYHGFDKRWASKKDYPERKPLDESELTPEFWQRYNYGNHLPIDRRTLR
jgi:hypothetical protein